MAQDSRSAGGETPGIFITFEGGEGAGKTTHVRILAAALESRGAEVLTVREPGGTKVGEMLRGIVLDPGNAALSARAELLIYEAARAQIVDEVIAPALARGAVVVCDRFTDSTVAYQAAGRGLARAFVDAANEFASQGIVPNRTILLRVGEGASEGLARATRRFSADRLEREGQEFHQRVNEAFAAIAAADPVRVRTVTSYTSKRRTARAVFDALADLFPWLSEPAVLDAAFDAVYGKRGKRRG